VVADEQHLPGRAAGGGEHDLVEDSRTDGGYPDPQMTSASVRRGNGTAEQGAGIPPGWRPGGKTRTPHPVPGEAAIVNQRAIWLGALTTCGLVAVLPASIIAIPRWPGPPLSAQARIRLRQAQSQLADDARSSVLPALAGLLVVAGALATWRQARISREGQITAVVHGETGQRLTHRQPACAGECC
jgi:hypothetical protein